MGAPVEGPRGRTGSHCLDRAQRAVVSATAAIAARVAGRVRPCRCIEAAGSRHAERTKEPAREHLFIRTARNRLDDGAQQSESGVRVAATFSRRRLHRGFLHRLHERGAVRRHPARAGADETGSVGQEMVNPGRVLRARKVAEIEPNRIVDREQALILEAQDRCRCEVLRERTDREPCLDAVRNGTLSVRKAAAVANTTSALFATSAAPQNSPIGLASSALDSIAGMPTRSFDIAGSVRIEGRRLGHRQSARSQRGSCQVPTRGGVCWCVVAVVEHRQVERYLRSQREGLDRRGLFITTDQYRRGRRSQVMIASVKRDSECGPDAPVDGHPFHLGR